MILQALDLYYDRMAARGEAEPPDWAKVGIDWTIELSPDGDPTAVLQEEEADGKKRRAKRISVPAPAKRAVNIEPNRFWDKTSYVLGRSADPKKTQAKPGKPARVDFEHAAFKALTLGLIGESDDAGLVALRRFLERWTPVRFDAPPFRPEVLDGNVVFRLAGGLGFIHDRAAACAALRRAEPAADEDGDVCLVTGVRAPPQRLHPTIKGMKGAQSSGASLVSFNLDAFKSYSREKGANAATSEAAAERYGAALNAMLASGERNRLRRGIGDATVVFWADARGMEDEAKAASAEALFAAVFAPPADAPQDDGDAGQARKLRDALTALAQGRPQQADPGLAQGVRFNVLGLSPNAARLSVRFWLSDSFDAFARAILRHMDDLAIEPAPRGWSGNKGPPEIWRLLIKTTAVQEKFENVPPLLAGDLARAILGGGPYPRSWLTAAVMRLRAGDDPSAGWHAAAIKACINRRGRAGRDSAQRPASEEELPVALRKDHPSEAYQLGRLFAVIERAQQQALGYELNSTVADKYFSTASSTPARVFPSLIRGAKSHAAAAKKLRKGYRLEDDMAEIIDRLDDLPRTLNLEDQGRFAVGYYHERAARRAEAASSKKPAASAAAPSAEHPEGALS